MSHVDDGRLHAFLDGALPGGAEARKEVEDHLRVCADCRALLEAARADREGAGEILSFLRPMEVEAPPLEELLARWREAPGPGAGSEDARRPSGPRFPLAWAATVVLAIGGGWIARGVLMGPPIEGRTELEVASVSESPAEPTPTADVDEPPSGPDAEPARAADAERVQLAAAEPVQVADTEPAQLAAAQPAPSVLELPAAAAPPVSQAVSGVRSRAALDAVEASASDLSAIEALLSEREANATAMSAWVAATPAEAARRLGRIPLQLDGLPWERMEIAELDGEILVRTVHPVAGDGRVELIQGRSVLDEPDRDDSMEVRREAFEREVSPAPAVVAERGGIALILRGLETREALESLLPQLR